MAALIFIQLTPREDAKPYTNSPSELPWGEGSGAQTKTAWRANPQEYPHRQPLSARKKRTLTLETVSYHSGEQSFVNK